MNKAFSLWLWENEPSANTPLSAEFLNRLNNGLNEVDNRVVEFSSTKANQSELLTAVADVVYDDSTGIFTVVKKNGSTKKIDTKLEKLAINFTYDRANQRLVITLDDGTIQYVDMKALITELEFLNSNTVLFSVTDGRVTANIAKGSITGDMLEPNYLANVEMYASQAVSSAQEAKGYAESANASALQAESQAKLAKQYTDSTNDMLEQVTQRLEFAQFDIDEKGNLIYTDNTSYIFTVDNNGMLNWEVA